MACRSSSPAPSAASPLGLALWLGKLLPQAGSSAMATGAGSWARRRWPSGSWLSELRHGRLCLLGLILRRRRKAACHYWPLGVDSCAESPQTCSVCIWLTCKLAIPIAATDCDAVPGTVLSTLHSLTLTHLLPWSTNRLELTSVPILGEEAEAQGG